MKKTAIVICVLLALVTSIGLNTADATEPGGGGGGGSNEEMVIYESTVYCPGGSVINISGKCCEPGQIKCEYVKCSGYTPPTVTCPPA